MSAALVIVSGPPGAGKTTLARRLAQAGPPPAVHLHTDDFYGAIVAGFIEPWLAESHPQNIVVTRVIVAAAGAYAAGGYRVVVDGVVGPWFLDSYREAAARAGLALDYVVLRPSKPVAVVRAAGREAYPLVEYPPGLYESFADLGPLESHVVDSEADLDALLGTIARGLAEGRFRLR